MSDASTTAGAYPLHCPPNVSKTEKALLSCTTNMLRTDQAVLQCENVVHMPYSPKIMLWKSVVPVETNTITQTLHSVPTAHFGAMFIVAITCVCTGLTSHCMAPHRVGCTSSVILPFPPIFSPPTICTTAHK